MKRFYILFLLCVLSTNVWAVEIAPEVASGFSAKHELKANHHMVVSGSAHASQAGDLMLQKGGNAIDAAIATQLVLNLVEPQASGIGGGGFILYYDKRTGKVEAYDGRETAPDAATSDMFLDKKGNAPEYLEALKGGLSVGTPGLLRMFEVAHKEHGKLPWHVLFGPAIKLSKEGFALSPRLYTIISANQYIVKSHEARELYFNNDGSVKPVGSIIKNHAFAQTLQSIATNGADAFYKGDIAKSIVEIVHNNPFIEGRLSEKDLINYQPKKRQPICETYRDYKLCGLPPPSSGGITILQSLKMLEHSNLKEHKLNSPESIHLIMEAARLAFADRNKYIADCAFSPVPIKAMLAPEYIKERTSLINPDKAIDKTLPGKLAWDKKCEKQISANEHPSTTHVSIVDNDGNAVSMTNSIEYSFGSGLMTNGFFLNNELTDFSLKPEINGEKVANNIEPGKRPRSSMSPILVFDKKGELYMVIGSPGGSRIISYVLQTIISVLDYEIKLNDAINQPHFATTGNEVELEKNTHIQNLSAPLEKLGQRIVIGDLTSGLHGIQIVNNKLISGVDSRREGAAVGK